ncbi:hypothetical protein JXA31_10415 [Candidatus Bathyarchaeota archaeon]|nr:hypothetical protein [Candidatus Bathyarchaeota archaeon]
MNSNGFKEILREVPAYRRFLKLSEIDSLTAKFERNSSIEKRTIGQTVEKEPINMYVLGSGKKTAMIIGVPHSDEPLGSLVTTHFIQWMMTHPEADFFQWRWLIIPVLERRGMRMNEGWFKDFSSLVSMAKSHFREPVEDQYEWTFPFKYKNYQWTYSRPEADAVKEVLKSEKPDLLCGLHHAGFYNTYYYFSRDLPEAYPRLRELAKTLKLPFSEQAADVPFGKVLAPGFYQMYGLKDYFDYYSKNEPENLSRLKRGACSDEWYEDTIGGFSFNCEVPLFQSSVKKDNDASERNLKDLLENKKRKNLVNMQYYEELLSKLEPFFAFSNPLLLNSVLKSVASTKLLLEDSASKKKPVDNRKATNFEVFENDVMADISDLLLLGQIWRVAKYIFSTTRKAQTMNLIKTVDQKMGALAESVSRRGRFVPMPIQKLVKMQLGSTLVIADVLLNTA